ncbi:hypothetical protein HPB51_026994 [Rhipicephalus microplus]|uniref:Uncharacterized protein n=1 Tax=Rhipicephalus microplus TaxID=6941 RepID=A0A9J6D110_RHIMP|nr:hypothetical protein HPB51_026994 [Rhipicephalus microplus]
MTWMKQLVYSEIALATMTKLNDDERLAAPPPRSAPSSPGGHDSHRRPPKSPVELTKLQPWHLYTALLQAAFLQDLPPASRDTVRIHPVNNTFTLSVADSARAQAYLRITSLTVSGNTFTVHLYAPPQTMPSGAYCTTPSTTSRTKPSLKTLRQAILPSLLWAAAAWARPLTSWSPSWSRNYRGGSSTTVSASPPSVPQQGGSLLQLPLDRPPDRRVPQAAAERCHRCGAAHPTPPEGSPPTCNPRCIVCNGNHPTYSSNVNTAYVQRPQRRRPRHLTHTPRHNSLFRRSGSALSQQAASGPSPAPPPKRLLPLRPRTSGA